MKNNILLLFLFIFSSGIYAQDTLTTYLNDYWKKTDKEHASYYRKTVMISKKNWSINDYYLNGQLQMSGFYLSKKGKKKNGHFTYYYKDGTKKSEWNLVKDVANGSYKKWFENSNPMEEGSYTNGNKSGHWKYWDEEGRIDSEGEYQDGYYEGIWKWYYENGKISSIEEYKHGELVSFKHFDKQGKEMKDDTLAVQPPEYIGGDTARLNFLKNNINYPQRLVDKNISGTVYLKFIVEKDGSISNVTVLRSVEPELDNEAVRVINRMPNWKPGKIHNRISRFGFYMPVRYKLTH